MRTRPFVLMLIGAIGVLVVAGIVTTLIAARQPVARYPMNSPEGTVATYLRLLQNGQVDRAYGLVSLDTEAPMEPPMTLQRFHAQFDSWSQTSHRATLVRSSVSGSIASVTVDITTFSAGAFGASDQTSRVTFTLKRTGGNWRITGPRYL